MKLKLRYQLRQLVSYLVIRFQIKINEWNKMRKHTEYRFFE